MIVDCADCLVRDIACGDCIVTVLLGAPSMPTPASGAPPSQAARISIDQEELGALGVLAEVGLVPQLRLVVSDHEEVDQSLSPRAETSSDRRAV